MDWNSTLSLNTTCITVTSLAEVWIETLSCARRLRTMFVTSLAEVWIETSYYPSGGTKLRSLPLRKCGLKRSDPGNSLPRIYVTSLAEVWIETPCILLILPFYCVTSLAEVWIETSCPLFEIKLMFGHFPCGSVDWNNPDCKQALQNVVSLPLRKCGLKLQ